MANTAVEMLAEKAGYFASLAEEALKAEQDKDKPRVQTIVTNGTILADLVQVVRCKDCKGWCPEEIAKQYGVDRYCTMTMIPTDADDFCSCGERREGE